MEDRFFELTTILHALVDDYEKRNEKKSNSQAVEARVLIKRNLLQNGTDSSSMLLSRLFAL